MILCACYTLLWKSVRTTLVCVLIIGRILNRFSKDVGFLDDVLPYFFCEFIIVSSFLH